MDQVYLTTEQTILYKTACYIKVKMTKAKDQTEVLEQRIYHIQARMEREEDRTVRYALLELELLQLQALKTHFARYFHKQHQVFLHCINKLMQ